MKPLTPILRCTAAVLFLAASVAAPAAHADTPVQPTIVMVHGAWADTSSWDGEVSALRARGYDARAIANPLRNLLTDAASVSAFLDTIDTPVVLVGHSYGGAVITQAAAGNPRVEALVYVDAAAPDIGETNGSLSGDTSILKTLPADRLFDTVPRNAPAADTSDLYLRRDVFLDHFGSDLLAETAIQLWATQRGASPAAFDTAATAAAWRTIASWYFISSGDQIITADAERRMAARAGARITEFDGGSHLTLVSHPEAVTAVIQSAIDSVT